MASLRMRMASSYVLVTVAAVLVVEAAMLALLLPKTLGDTATGAVQQRASQDAKQLSLAATKVYHNDGAATADEVLGDMAKIDDDNGGGGALFGRKASGPKIPRTSDQRAVAFEALATVSGSVVTSTAPNAYPQGMRLPVPAAQSGGGSGTARVDGAAVAWAAVPVVIQDTDELPATPGEKLPGDGPGKGLRVIGAVYVQVPRREAQAAVVGPLRPLLVGGGVVLLLVLPVGAVFGLLSTRRLIRRVHRLARVTASVAGGDFGSRVAVEDRDELGALEDSVNRMAEQLDVALENERRLAGAGARQAERARIARELHDSISQDLFSLSLLAGGLRRALPEGDGLRTQAEAMERTTSRTMREMQAMLLELRPVDLEDAGLVPAIDELCRAYETRLGIKVDADLREVSLPPPAEHAVLRVIQEALGNAIKHGDPKTVGVRLAGDIPAGKVTLEVRDDGCGFDPVRVKDRHGMGLGLMRERVAELGGALEVTSGPGDGTTVRVHLPAGEPA